MHRRASIGLLVAGLLMSAAACLGTVRLEQSLSPAFGDLTTVKLVELVNGSGEVLMRGTFSAPSTSGAKVERTAELTRPTNQTPTGEVSIDVDRNAGISEEEMIVKAEDLPYPASCRVMVDGLEVAAFSTSQDGKINLKLSRRIEHK